ncbi:MAG TPA: polysaccharide deacetylase family protein, partial [Nitrosomonas sp.]|nr:polysaccharide deacetylase family protein [Nitrosomonas sp.]
MKIAILYFAKLFGLFAFASWCTQYRIRILGYHGVWFSNGHFGNFLYINPEKFQSRIKWLKQSKYSVIPLSNAINALQQDKVVPYTTVITIDDGWYGTYKYMLPVLEQESIPAALYVYTEAVESQNPLFHILIPALIQLSQKSILEVSANEIGDALNFDISDSEKKVSVSSRIIELLNQLEEQKKEAFCRNITTALGFDFEEICKSRQFSFMTFDEIRNANKRGLDIQLHTHTHTVDINAPEKIVTEIQINREKLMPYVTSELEHFCYPSGVHNDEMYQYLKQNKVISATVTDTGLATTRSNLFALKRILDG